ncbi:RNA polymerase sigma-70 factor [Chitinophaga agrisoli]|uniref:RNA polymerase sigma-70 factor n=1 Tax=Chitinophaga agrisoli TaxID=2607653 RepID=A0A5B2VXN5_9BACT|nr:RNA polymerase sigma-70 factor [Chitinophaga agrisoli]KAA2243370.1 RNA polymerase sigma-70 factor [Chitinophaga agrisoli]
MSTFTTIAALKEGDASVFKELFNEYHGKVYLYVLSKTHSEYMAEEVTQITFIKLWNYRQHLNESEPVAKLIFHIARATTIDLFRKEAVRGKLQQQEKPTEADTSNSAEAVEVKELQQRIRQLVHKMPPVRRKVFELSRYEFKSYKEIAELLSLSVKTVENHMTLAIKHLRNILTLLLLVYLLR